MSKAESKRKKEGLFQLNEPPEALPVLGENATTTPGGFMSDLRTNLATKLNMDEQKIQQCVGDPSLSLLDAYLGVSTSALFPEKYLKSIIKNFKILLALRHVPPQLIEKVAKDKLDELIGRWIDFSKTKQAKQLGKGCNSLRIEFAGLAGGGGGGWQTSRVKPQTKKKSQSDESPAKGAEDSTSTSTSTSKSKSDDEEDEEESESEEAPFVVFGDDSEEEVEKKSPRAQDEDLSRILDALVSGDDMGVTLQKLKPNMSVILKATTTEEEIYAILQWYAKSNPVMLAAIADADAKAQSPAAVQNHELVTPTEKMFGFFPRSREALSSALQSFKFGEPPAERAQRARESFSNWGNDANSPAELTLNFEKAVKLLIAEGGTRPTDDGPLAAAFKKSLEKSPLKKWRRVWDELQVRELKSREELAFEHAKARQMGEQPKPPVLETLAYVVDKTRIVHDAIVAEDVKTAADAAAKKQKYPPRPPKSKPKGGGAAEDEDGDGPSAVANSATTATICHLCQGQHFMNGKRPDGTRIHSKVEVEAYWESVSAERKKRRAEATAAQKPPATVHAPPAGKGKNKGQGKGKGTGKGSADGGGQHVWQPAGAINNQAAQDQGLGKGKGKVSRGKGNYFGKGGKGYKQSGGAAQQEESWDESWDYAGGTTMHEETTLELAINHHEAQIRDARIRLQALTQAKEGQGQDGR
jgi:hypothetical protein